MHKDAQDSNKITLIPVLLLNLTYNISIKLKSKIVNEKVDNLIYYSICESSLDLVPAQYGSYREYCNFIKNTIDVSTLEPKELYMMSKVTKHIETVHGLTEEEAAPYVIDFFYLGKFIELEEKVKNDKTVFLGD